MTALQQLFHQLRADHSEAETIALIAEQLDESRVETVRILRDVGHVKLGGSAARKKASDHSPGDKGRSGVENRGARRRAQADTDDGRSDDAPQRQLDVAAVQAAYRSHREAGLRSEPAVTAIARTLNARPHDVRRVCGIVELALRDELDRGDRHHNSQRKDV
jgi:hypothetical protein